MYFKFPTHVHKTILKLYIKKNSPKFNIIEFQE